MRGGDRKSGLLLICASYAEVVYVTERDVYTTPTSRRHRAREPRYEEPYHYRHQPHAYREYTPYRFPGDPH